MPYDDLEGVGWRGGGRKLRGGGVCILIPDSLCGTAETHNVANQCPQ